MRNFQSSTPTHQRAFGRLIATVSAVGLGITALGMPAAHSVVKPSTVTYALVAAGGVFVGPGQSNNAKASGQIVQVPYGADGRIIEEQVATVGDDLEFPFPETPGVRSWVNSLGVSPDGDFYFTVQNLRIVGGSNPTRDYQNVEVWKFTEEDGQTLVVGDYQLAETDEGTVVGGAVNPIDNAYYFVNFTSFDTQEDAEKAEALNPAAFAEIIRANVSKLDPATGLVSVAARVDIPKNESFRMDVAPNRKWSLNGDLAFDSQGNMHLVSSLSSLVPPGNPGGVIPVATMTASVEYDRFAAPSTSSRSSAVSAPVLSPTFTLGAAGQNPIVTEGPSVYNGVAFMPSGEIAVQRGSVQTLANPVTFTPTGEPVDLMEILAPASGRYIDLASSMVPPTLTVKQRLVGERFDSGDQFVLTAEHTHQDREDVTLSVTTTGDQSEIQVEQIGPQVLLAGGQIDVRTELTANADQYETEYECTYAIKGEAFELAEGEGTEVDPTLDFPVGAESIDCMFTSSVIPPIEEPTEKPTDEPSAPVEEPTDEPSEPAEEPTSPSPEPEASPTTAPTGELGNDESNGAAGSTDDEAALAETGFGSSPAVIWAALLVLGGFLVIGTRRARQR